MSRRSLRLLTHAKIRATTMPTRDYEALQQLLAEFAASEQVLPRGRLGVPLEKAYRDSASRAALTVCRTFPSIVAQTSKSHELLLDREALEDCSDSIPALREAIRRSARVRGLDVG